MTDFQSEGPEAKTSAFALGERISTDLGTAYSRIRELEKRIQELEQQAADHNRLSSQLQHQGSSNSTTLETSSRPSTRQEIVVLIHGIRDHALWQSQVRETLRDAGFRVELTSYGRFDLFRFLAPVPFFRRSVINNVSAQVRIIRRDNPDAEISIIAHSFGTFVASRVIAEGFDIIFRRIIFCGAVFSKNIPFEQFSNRFVPPIINEVGERDFWPAVANSITWGYSAPGTFGIRRPLFEDRWHSELGHNFFLTAQFCSRYWVPFLRDGFIESANRDPSAPSGFVDFISTFHLKYIVIFLVIIYIIIGNDYVHLR